MINPSFCFVKSEPRSFSSTSCCITAILKPISFLVLCLWLSLQLVTETMCAVIGQHDNLCHLPETWLAGFPPIITLYCSLSSQTLTMKSSVYNCKDAHHDNDYSLITERPQMYYNILNDVSCVLLHCKSPAIVLCVL